MSKAMPHRGFALFMEQRTGKTKTALAIAERRGVKRLLILCPKIAIRVWKTELRFEGLSTRMHAQVLTYEYAANHIEELLDPARKPEMIIADESQRIKRRTSARSKAARELAAACRYTLALTGTPMDKHQDVWAQFDFLNPRLFGTWEEFRNRFLQTQLVKLPPKRIQQQDGSFKVFARKPFLKILGLQKRRTDEFNRLFHSIAFRVTLEEVKEEKTAIRHIRVRFPLKESLEAYQSMENEMVTYVSGSSRVATTIVIAQATKLQQITGGSIVDTAQRTVHQLGREKEHALLDVLDHMEYGQPFVVVARYIHEIDAIQALLANRGLSSTEISGRTSHTSFTTDAAVIQIQSGVAIDLKRASTMVFYSMDFSSLNFEQMLFRIRSMVSDVARYYYLLAEGTIDEHIFRSVRTKQSLAKLLYDKFREERKNGREKTYQAHR